MRIRQSQLTALAPLVEYLAKRGRQHLTNLVPFGPPQSPAKWSRVYGRADALDRWLDETSVDHAPDRAHGYRVIAYEANARTAVECSDYVSGRTDDRQKAVGGMGVLVWQVEENGK